MSKVIFQDVDGPLIPGRLYYAQHAHMNADFIWLYDPVAVGMLREICTRRGVKIVYSTAHNEEDPNMMRYKARVNGMEDLLHEDCQTKFRSEMFSKQDAIVEWLRRHPEVDSWLCIDDEDVFRGPHPQHVKVEFSVGLTIDNFHDIDGYFSGRGRNAKPKIVGL